MYVISFSLGYFFGIIRFVISASTLEFTFTKIHYMILIMHELQLSLIYCYI